MHCGKLTAATLIFSASMTTGCQEPGYTSVVHSNGQGGGYSVERVKKTPEELTPRPAPVARPESLTPAQQADETKAVEASERDFAVALRAGDALALAAVLAPEFVQTGLTGNRTTRPQFLDDVKNKSLVVDSAALSDLQVSLHDNTAIATGKLTLAAKLRGGDIGGDYRFTDTLMQREGRWLKIASQISKAAL